MIYVTLFTMLPSLPIFPSLNFFPVEIEKSDPLFTSRIAGVVAVDIGFAAARTAVSYVAACSEVCTVHALAQQQSTGTFVCNKTYRRGKH